MTYTPIYATELIGTDIGVVKMMYNIGWKELPVEGLNGYLFPLMAKE